MREYTLKVARIRNAGKGQYDVCIDIIDDEKQTSAPYKIVKVDAINEDIAVKKANIILEEMFYSEETLLDIQSMYVEYVKSNHIKNYSSLAIELDRLRTKYEDELTAFVKNAQISETEGIDVEDLEIYVDLDGRAELLVEAIRVCNDEQWDNMVELFVPDDEGEMVWMSIYDFYPDTAIKILTALMESE
jgi:hypothetical protein